jgi:hypothetical protein
MAISSGYCRGVAACCTEAQHAGINGSRLVGRTVVRRQDFTITNLKHQRLQCSYWQTDAAGTSRPLPAVIYCHCNSGSRLDAVEAIWTLVPLGVRVFALDFSVLFPCLGLSWSWCD